MRSQYLQDTALRYFMEVVRSGSLTAASERLHVASSAISRQIMWLEEALETPLFERLPRGMKATAAGEVLAAYALRCSLEADRTLEEITALAGLRSGRVRIATSEGFATDFLPEAISRFRAQHANVRFDMKVAAPVAVSDLVRQGEVDIGLTFSRVAQKDIRVVYRHAAPILALLPRGHELAQARSLTLARLAGYALALPDATATVRQMIDVAASRQQLVLEPALTSNNVSSLLSFVLHGGGVTLASKVSVRWLMASGELVAVPLRDRGLDARDIELQVMVGRTLPAAVEGFLRHLQASLAEGA
jgi:DNA-binding transcriptional LysR family regulator